MSLVWTAVGLAGVPRAARKTTGSVESESLTTSKKAPGVVFETRWSGAAGLDVLMPS